eukprot:gene16300-21600_t
MLAKLIEQVISPSNLLLGLALSGLALRWVRWRVLGTTVLTLSLLVMAVCGWALQAMNQGPEFAAIAEQVKAPVEQITGKPCPHSDVKAWLERELGCGLRT